MLPDRVSNPGPQTYESGALPIALRGPALCLSDVCYCCCSNSRNDCPQVNQIHYSNEAFIVLIIINTLALILAPASFLKIMYQCSR